MKKILLSSMFLVCSFMLFAQKDKVIVTEEDETMEMQEKKYLEKYFIRDTIQENQLWKINAVDWGLLNPSINFEKRICKNLSFEVGARYAFSKTLRTKYYFNHGFVFNTNLRYYYNYNARREKGKNTNGFSGNYFTLGCKLGYSETYFGSYYPNQKEYRVQYNMEEYFAAYGIQRRIGNFGYIDIAAGLKYSNLEHYFMGFESTPNSISPMYKIAIGFAKSSFSRKKVKL